MRWPGLLLLVVCCAAACLPCLAEEVVDTGDFDVVLSSKQGPFVAFLYEEDSPACEDGDCAAYSVQFTGLYELHNNKQVAQSGIGFSHIPWSLSAVSQLQDDPLCDCATQVVTITNDGAGSEGAWTSLSISVHIPAAVGTTHLMADLAIEGFQWRDVQAQQLVVELQFTANDAQGLVPVSSMLTDGSTTAQLADGYLQMAPIAEAVSQSSSSHIQVPTLLNATMASVQLRYGGFPAGYDFTSQLTMGIDSSTDPAILPAMKEISSDSSRSAPGNVVVGLALAGLLVLVFVAILSAFLWYNSSSRTLLNRMLDRSSKEEARPLSA